MANRTQWRKPYQCVCGETDPDKFRPHQKSECLACFRTAHNARSRKPKTTQRLAMSYGGYVNTNQRRAPVSTDGLARLGRPPGKSTSWDADALHRVPASVEKNISANPCAICGGARSNGKCQICYGVQCSDCQAPILRRQSYRMRQNDGRMIHMDCGGVDVGRHRGEIIAGW